MRVVVAEGDAMTRGRTVGRELGDLIARSMDFYHQYFERRGVSSPRMQELLTPHMAAAEASTPELVNQIRGMAEGAVVPVVELFAMNAFEELEPLLHPVNGHPLFLEQKEGHRPTTAQRCSTFTMTGPGLTLLGHNEHWLAGDLGNVAVVIEQPGEGHTSIAAPTNVCFLPAVGMNSHGEAQGIQSLTADDDRPGVPRVLESRHVLESKDREGAIRAAALPNRAGGYGHTIAFSGGEAFTIETTATREVVFDGPGIHTNHYLDPGLAELAPEPSASSVARLEIMQRAIKEQQPETPEAVMEILSLDDCTPPGTEPEEDPGDDLEAIVYSMVCDVENGRMWVAPGHPRETAYQEIDIAGVR